VITMTDQSNTPTRGLVTAIGEIDLAPAVRDGQPVILVWAGDGEGEPAVLPIRDALVLIAALRRTWDQAIALAADRLADGPP
jgi:hypothetical protein